MMLSSSATGHQPSFTSTPVRDASAAAQSCSRTAASAALRGLAVCVLLLLTCSSASAQASNNNLFGGGPRHLCIFLSSMPAHASQSRETQLLARASKDFAWARVSGPCSDPWSLQHANPLTHAGDESNLCQSIGNPWSFRPCTTCHGCT